MAADDSFRQEVAIMASLQNHPAIAVLFGYLEQDMKGLVMKPYAGGLNQLVTAT